MAKLARHQYPDEGGWGGVAGCEVKPVAAGVRSVCGGVFVHREPWAAFFFKVFII